MFVDKLMNAKQCLQLLDSNLQLIGRESTELNSWPEARELFPLLPTNQTNIPERSLLRNLFCPSGLRLPMQKLIRMIIRNCFKFPMYI
jgi:hypothetical protein